MGDVVEALQRISRLRPTLLVLEDIHLFPSEIHSRSDTPAPGSCG